MYTHAPMARIGRPKKGPAKLLKGIGVRVPPEVMEEVDQVAAIYDEKRSNAACRLISIGLQAMNQQNDSNWVTLTAVWPHLSIEDRARVAAVAQSFKEIAESDIYPTDAEIAAELESLERQLRAEPDIYGVGLGGSLKVGRAQIETLIQARLEKRRQELLNDRNEKRVVVNKGGTTAKQANDAPTHLTTDSPDTNKSIPHEVHDETASSAQPPPPLEKNQPTRKANMKSLEPPLISPVDDVELTSPHKMRRSSLAGRHRREPPSAAVERDVAKAQKRSEEIEKEDDEQ